MQGSPRTSLHFGHWEPVLPADLIMWLTFKHLERHLAAYKEPKASVFGRDHKLRFAGRAWMAAKLADNGWQGAPCKSQVAVSSRELSFVAYWVANFRARCLKANCMIKSPAGAAFQMTKMQEEPTDNGSAHPTGGRGSPALRS